MTPIPIPDPEVTRADRRQRAEARRRAADAELVALDADVSGPLDQFAAAERRIVRARTQLERTTADLATARAERSAAIAAIRATLAPYVDAGASGPAVAAAHGIPEYWVRPDPVPTPPRPSATTTRTTPSSTGSSKRSPPMPGWEPSTTPSRPTRTTTRRCSDVADPPPPPPVLRTSRPPPCGARHRPPTLPDLLGHLARARLARRLARLRDSGPRPARGALGARPMTISPPRPTAHDAEDRLVAALQAVYAACDREPGLNLPEALSLALGLLSRRLGATNLDQAGWVLTKHRPGSWEAAAMRQLIYDPELLADC